MNLPFSREQSHGAGAPIAGTTIDAIQDCIKGNKKPVLTRVFGPNGGGVLPIAPANWGNNIGTSPASNYGVSTGVVSMLIYLPCETGDRITGIATRVFGDGAADCTYTPGYLDASGVLQAVSGNTTDTNRAAAWGDQALAFTTRTLLALEMPACFVAINATNYRIQKWIVTYDRP